MKQNFSQIVCVSTLVAIVISAMQVLAGGKGDGGGEDIILYKNNIIIRGEGGKGKGKGKGGGGGNLLLAPGPEKEYHDLGWDHHEHGGHGHQGHHGYGDMHHQQHHGHKELPPIIFLGGNGGGKGKGKGSKGKGGNKGNNKGSNEDEMGMSIEQMLMAQMG